MIREAAIQDLPAVDALRRADQTAVGFIPMSRYEAEIGRGTILVLEESGDILGYIFWTKGWPIAAIQQLVIRQDARRMVRGLRLVDAMIGQVREGWYGVRCRCRMDLEAMVFWPAAGFTQVATTESGRRGPIAVFYQAINEGLFSPDLLVPGTAFGRLAAQRRGFRTVS